MAANRLLALTSALFLVTAATLNCHVKAYDPQTKQAGNSGRRLALIIPGMPHPASNSSIPGAHASRLKADTISISIPSPVGDDGAVGLPIGNSARIRLTPQAQQAVITGMNTLQDVSWIAYKRLADLCTWVWLLLKQNQQAPLATPANSMLPLVNVSEMHAIAEPSKGMVHQLVFTSERRLRTVVGR